MNVQWYNGILSCRFFTVKRIRNAVVFVILLVSVTTYLMVTRTMIPRKLKTVVSDEKPNRIRSSKTSSRTTITRKDSLTKRSTLAVVGTDVSFTKLKDFQENSNYLLIIPRASSKVHSLVNTNLINRADSREVVRLLRVLDKQKAYDGATCMGSVSEPRIHSSCYFETRNWTLLIGGAKTNGQHSGDVIECNIIEHAFIIRRKVFETLHFNPQYGETTLLDFYLRSKGKLKIAGFLNCGFSEDLNRRDRGGLVGSSFFTDYIYLGAYHEIVRIVRENEITWTKCSHHSKLCPEKPLNHWNMTSPTKLRPILPVCCSEVLDKMLNDVVQALQSMGLEYRLEYGTLLGAVRSGAIIPWTRDIDIGLKEDDYFHENTFSGLERLLHPHKYSVPVFKGQRRVIPLFPPKRRYSGSPFDPSFQKRLFSRRVMSVVQRLATTQTRWLDLGYLDFYIVSNEQFKTHTTIQINNKSYSTFVDVKEKLEKWYGPKYMNPAKKISAAMEIDITKRKKQREKERRKRREKRNAKEKRRKRREKRNGREIRRQDKKRTRKVS